MNTVKSSQERKVLAKKKIAVTIGEKHVVLFLLRWML